MEYKYICVTKCPKLDEDNTAHCLSISDDNTFCPFNRTPEWKELSTSELGGDLHDNSISGAHS